jgi:hypothetical protein
MRRALVLVALVVAGCGGSQHRPAPDQPARATVQRYLAALGHGDAAAVCREFTAESREKLAEFGEEHLSVKPGSCRRVVARLLGSPAGAALHRLGGARITGVDLHGGSAEVSVAGLDRPTEVVREAGGVWRIRSEPSGETD